MRWPTSPLPSLTPPPPPHTHTHSPPAPLPFTPAHGQSIQIFTGGVQARVRMEARGQGGTATCTLNTQTGSTVARHLPRPQHQPPGPQGPTSGVPRSSHPHSCRGGVHYDSHTQACPPPAIPTAVVVVFITITTVRLARVQPSPQLSWWCSLR